MTWTKRSTTPTRAPISKPRSILAFEFLLGFLLCEWLYFKEIHKCKCSCAKIVEKASSYISVNNSTKDDLKVVEGIGPAIEKVLNEAGIHTYSEIVNTGADKIKTILEAKGSLFQFHNPATWPEQAALLRDGKFEEFKQLEAQLKGGIRV